MSRTPQIFRERGCAIAVIFAYSLFFSATGAFAQGRAILGIGDIVDTLDYTTDSFNIFRFFKTHKVMVGADTVEPRLVDRAADAHFAITGRIGSEINFRKEEDDRSFRYSHEAKLTIWRDGKKIDDVSASCDGTTRKTDKRQDTAYDDLRYTTMLDCFDKLRVAVGTVLTRARLTGGWQ